MTSASWYRVFGGPVPFERTEIEVAFLHASCRCPHSVASWTCPAATAATPPRSRSSLRAVVRYQLVLESAAR